MKVDAFACAVVPSDSISRFRRRCYLVRHGDIESFQKDTNALESCNFKLSDKGIRQVRELAVMLQDVTFDRAVCSDYPHAYQTARILLDEQEGMLERAEAFREIKAGCQGNIPRHERHDLIGVAYETIDEVGGTFLGGEDWDSFEARVLEQFHLIVSESSWRSLLIVSHDAVNRILLAWAMGGDRHCVKGLEQDYACLNIIDLDLIGQQVVKCLVRGVNITPYDPCKVFDQRTGERVHELYYSNAEKQ
ncbi:histidine phosphatase family protein [Pseudomonas carnis]|jgi:probable phosphoglycerate mutase|uniref:Histidine phosphatase family protein n=1 Tax=Pseudomonas carnis TaxID=2487355 RepID=A0ABT5RLX8_9PSED|nr:MULTISPECIES: histidine phosphatase family protein [Pseudomonas]MDD1947003.1 histidine phosphatase family protein [Pseudomonas carnis]USX02289.1 histidine phosphatase family protein [Pseudomonas proteolytica]